MIKKQILPLINLRETAKKDLLFVKILNADREIDEFN